MAFTTVRNLSGIVYTEGLSSMVFTMALKLSASIRYSVNGAQSSSVTLPFARGGNFDQTELYAYMEVLIVELCPVAKLLIV